MGNGGGAGAGDGDTGATTARSAGSPPAKRRGRPPLPRDEHGNIILPDGTTKPPSKKKNYYTPVAVQRGEVPAEPPPPRPAAPVQTLAADGLPPAIVGGQPNPEHWRAKMAAVSRLCHLVTIGEAEFPKGFNPAQVLEVLKSEAKYYGLDPSHLMDARTEAEKALDAAKILRETPLKALEQLDEVIGAMESAMDAADRGCAANIEEVLKPPDGSVAAMEMNNPKSSWRSLFQRIKKLRQRARMELPQGGDRTDNIRITGVRAAHPLRFMIYCGQSSMKRPGVRGPASRVFEIAPHHCKMAVDVYEAKHGIHFDAENRQIIYGEIGYKGVILICPPGHGKSVIGRHVIGLTICLDNYTQGHVVHAVDAKASQNLDYVASLFRDDNDDGRRCLSLFPHLKLADYDNNSERMRLALPEKVKQPTLSASGITAKVSGDDSNLQWWDDPIDQEIIDQPSDRERIFNRLNGTWMRRMRGTGGLIICTATLWHHEDPIFRFINLSREGKSMFRVSIQTCGGPNEKPAFRPLWKNVYNSDYLRTTYNEMRNPRLYAAQFQADPRPDEQRIIRRLKFYDPADPNHRPFVAGAVCRLSLDPSATRNEKADKAGAVYLASGLYIDRRFDENGQEYVSERPLCRVLDAFEMHATQSDLVEYGLNYAQTHAVDWVHVEVRSGFQGFAEMFESRGIDPIRHDPGNKNKGERLKAVAPMIENANAQHGFEATVEFPGVRQADGSLGPDPRYAFLYEQILDFGVCGQDHCLDALTQVVNYLASELGVGRGAVTTAVQAQRSMAGIDPRKRAMLEQLRREERRGRTGEEEIDGWLRSTWR